MLLLRRALERFGQSSLPDVTGVLLVALNATRIRALQPVGVVEMLPDAPSKPATTTERAAVFGDN